MGEERVIQYYLLCNKLKRLIRTGWKDWKVKKRRRESVAEHVFGVQMLAIAMHSEFKYDLDLFKVIFMIAIHELEETVIGDLTHFQITEDLKKQIGHEAVEHICEGLLTGEQIKSIIFEFDERQTPEAKFAYWCDKLEFDLQSKVYSDEKAVNIYDQDDNSTSKAERVQELLAEKPEFGYMILKYGQERYDYDDNFRKVSNYALTHNMRVKR